jgi:hypothetical protein
VGVCGMLRGAVDGNEGSFLGLGLGGGLGDAGRGRRWATEGKTKLWGATEGYREARSRCAQPLAGKGLHSSLWQATDAHSYPQQAHSVTARHGCPQQSMGCHRQPHSPLGRPTQAVI